MGSFAQEGAGEEEEDKSPFFIFWAVWEDDGCWWCHPSGAVVHPNPAKNTRLCDFFSARIFLCKVLKGKDW